MKHIKCKEINDFLEDLSIFFMESGDFNVVGKDEDDISYEEIYDIYLELNDLAESFKTKVFELLDFIPQDKLSDIISKQ